MTAEAQKQEEKVMTPKERVRPQVAMTSKERVRAAVGFQDPDRLPIYYFNRDQERSDILMGGYQAAADFVPAVPNQSEWGFVWHRQDDTMGQPKEPPLQASWDLLEQWTPPDPYAPGRMDSIKRMVDEHPDHYVIGGLGITGFNLVTFIRGFENVMADFYLDPENLETLIKIVTDFETGIIHQMCACGVDAIAFGDDWGTQTSLMVSPELFRRFFKPYYQRQFAVVKSYGCQVYFHCCGQVFEILDDLIEIGADILNLNQPDIFPLARLSAGFRGRVCFNCPVDHQTVALFGDDDEIHDYAARLVRELGTEHGGFMAYIEEYHSIGMSEQNYQSICHAFETLKAGGFDAGSRVSSDCARSVGAGNDDGGAALYGHIAGGRR